MLLDNPLLDAEKVWWQLLFHIWRSFWWYIGHQTWPLILHWTSIEACSTPWHTLIWWSHQGLQNYALQVGKCLWHSNTKYTPNSRSFNIVDSFFRLAPTVH
jgi:hypothetical protein